MLHMRHNMHIHTFRSGCGQPEMVISDIVDRAIECGLEVIGLADHVNLGSEREISFLHEDRRDVERLQPRLKVLVGTEVTMLSTERPAITTEQAEGLDFVMIAANHYHLTDIVQQPPELSAEAIAEHGLAMLEGAIESGMADIIAHPLVLTKVGWFTPDDIMKLLTRERLAPVLRKAGERGTAMELNPRLVDRHAEFYATFIPACKEHGVRFALGSDAHSLDVIPYADDGVYHGAGPDDLAALGVEEGDLIDPAGWPRR
ncbi:MAG: PHP domain-containing protein [Armatimonadota bacterium]|nr:MAG: PHP domain-containing protein [Armatimonadota bacterium]